jgi:protoporphyrinogen oxidase
MAAMYITKLKKNGIPLDDELACVWLRKLFGPRVYRDIWEPLLTAKFGDQREKVPAYWVWNTLNREKNGSQEVKGAVKGGYPRILDCLEQAVRTAGGAIHLNTPVRGVETIDRGMRVWLEGGQQDFDAVLSTLPLPQLRGLASNGLETQIPLPQLSYQGVVNVLLVTRQRLDRFYWTAVVDSGFAFQGIVETTHVIDPQWIGGRNLLYVMNYCSADTPLYNRDEAELKRDAVAGLARLYPSRFDPQQVESAHVFRAPFVEPVWPLGYLRQRPAARVGDTRLFLATTAQAYPMVTSWNTSVKLAEDAIQALQQACGDVATPTPLATVAPIRS